MSLRMTSILAATLTSLSPALADQFNINVTNGESGMLFVVVHDLNIRDQSRDTVFDATMTPGQFVPVNITGNAGGDGHIRWEAQSTDRQKCGGSEENGLSSGNNITVRTPSNC